MTAAIAPKRRQAALGFIFVTALLDVMSLGIMIPVLPNLIKAFNGGDTAAAAVWNVAFATSWGLMQFLCSPLVGMASDRWGRRPVLLISIFGLGVDYLFMAMAPSLAWLWVGRIINGITAASFSTCSAYIADVTAPEGRPRRSDSSARRGVWASCSARPWAERWRRSICGCRSSSARDWPWPTGCTACWCCPNPCRRKSASRASTGSGPIRWAR